MIEGRGRAAATGAMIGALAGVFVALGDFGATWLWLPLWRDRAGLLVRLLGFVPPIGALIGALAGWAGVFAWRALSARTRRDDLFPLPFVILSLPIARLLALKLCSGGSMSRLSQRVAIEWALTLLLPAGLYAALRIAIPIARAIAKGRLTAGWVSASLLALSFALGKVNQTVLPNLYEYLHGALALFAWSVAALGTWAALAIPRISELTARVRGHTLSLLHAGLVLAFALDLLTLDLNLNVRVALFDARAPTSRALLTVGHPVLRLLETRGRDRPRGSGLARGEIDTTGLPTQAGAHVVLVTIDALRSDHLGAYGYSRPVSPGLDALARTAVVFERAYAQAPHSSYSLSSLHTSEYVHELVELGHGLPETTLASTFKRHGYHTAAFFTDGIFHTEGAKLGAYRDNAFGFDLFDHTNRESEDQTDRVIQEIDRIKGQGEPPSFLWVHYFDVHEPYQETTFGKGEMERYDSEILHVDRELARLIRELDARFDREVVVAITADHGEEFREHGGVYHGSTLYEEQVRVPLIVRAHALTPKRIAAPVEVIDVAPTLLGLAGLEPVEGMRGRDLRAIALGRVADPGPVFSAVLTKRMAVRWPYKIIADLRFGLFELYDLSRDPSERTNLANREPQRLTEMRGLVYAWLDSIEDAGSAHGDRAEDVYQKALRWGRLGDRRAVEPMSQLLLDEKAKTEMRIEAGQILAKLADTSCAPALVKGMHTKPASVAAEAAIALGRMYDARAKGALARLVHVEDPYVRARAAVSLGRLRDRAAVPALIDALWVAPTQYEREEAVRWLGRLRAESAVEPLLSLLPEFNLRYLLAVALGQIGDARAYEALADMIKWEHHTNIRDEVVRGLGLLGDPRSVEALVQVLETEPGLKNTSESLVRLSAIERGFLGGTDLSPDAKGAQGFERCEAGPLFHDWDYLQRTSCVTRGPSAQLRLALPTSHARWADGALLVVRARRSDGPTPTSLTLTLGARELAKIRIDGSWSEQRVAVDPGQLAETSVRLKLTAEESSARFAVDHVLLVPRTQALLVRSQPVKPADDTKEIP